MSDSYYPTDSDDVDVLNPVDWSRPENQGLALALWGDKGLAGGSAWRDATGKNAAAVVNGPTWTADSKGQLGLSFNGTNQAVQTPTLQLAGQKLTFATWFWWSGFASDDALLAELGPNIGTNPPGFYVDPNSSFPGSYFEIAVRGDVASNRFFYTRPTAQSWYRLVCVFDFSAGASGELTAYLNGSLWSVQASSLGGDNGGNFSPQPLNLMSRNAGSLFGGGELASPTIWNRALTADQVANDYLYSLNPATDPRKQRVLRWMEIGAGGGNVTVSPAKLSLALTMKTPSVSVSGNIAVSPAKLALALSFKTPIVTATNNKIVSPAKLALSLSLKTPTVAITNNIVVAPAKLSLALTMKTPVVVTGGNKVVQPAKLSLTLAMKTPTVVVDGPKVLSPAKLRLTLTFKTPVVTVGGGAAGTWCGDVGVGPPRFQGTVGVGPPRFSGTVGVGGCCGNGGNLGVAGYTGHVKITGPI